MFDQKYQSTKRWTGRNINKEEDKEKDQKIRVLGLSSIVKRKTILYID